MDLFDNPALLKYLVGGGVVLLLLFYWLGRELYFSAASGQTPSVPDEPNMDGKPIAHGESLWSISKRLGEDVRDVWMMGYSDEQINGVLTGKCSLKELYQMEPDGNSRTQKGSAILAEKGRRG